MIVVDPIARKDPTSTIRVFFGIQPLESEGKALGD